MPNVQSFYAKINTVLIGWEWTISQLRAFKEMNYATITGVQRVFCPGLHVFIRLYFYAVENCVEFKSKKCKNFEFIYLKKLKIDFKIRKFI